MFILNVINAYLPITHTIKQINQKDICIYIEIPSKLKDAKYCSIQISLTNKLLYALILVQF